MMRTYSVVDTINCGQNVETIYDLFKLDTIKIIYMVDMTIKLLDGNDFFVIPK